MAKSNRARVIHSYLEWVRGWFQGHAGGTGGCSEEAVDNDQMVLKR